jgi:hypothetical protein
VYDLYCALEDKEREFLGLTSKIRWTVCQWFVSCLTSKSVMMISPVLVSKSVAAGFLVWVLKPAGTTC